MKPETVWAFGPKCGFTALNVAIAGGRPAEQLLTRLGMPASDDAVLPHLKSIAASRPVPEPRAVGIDEWAWRKGWNFGTIIVDLQSREVVDVLPDRSSATVTDWLHRHPSVLVISRDRDGLYAGAGRTGAPQACQVADRCHLLQNFRTTVERKMTAHSPASCLPVQTVLYAPPSLPGATAALGYARHSAVECGPLWARAEASQREPTCRFMNAC